MVRRRRRCWQGRGATPRSLTARRRIRPGAAVRRTGHAPSITCPSCCASAAPRHWTTRAGRGSRPGARDRAPRHRRPRSCPAAVPGTWRSSAPRRVTGKVSIIIPTCAAKGYIETCINTLRERTAYTNFEIVCHRQHPRQRDGAGRSGCSRTPTRSSTCPTRSTGRASTTAPSQVADGEYLLFLNDDIEIIQDDWLDAMLEHAQRPGGRHRRPAAAVSRRQGAARRHVPGQQRHRPPCLPLRGRGRARLFRPGADPAQRHGGHRRLHAGPPRDVRPARRLRRSAHDHQQRPGFLPARPSSRPADRVHALRDADPPRTRQPRRAEGRLRPVAFRRALEDDVRRRRPVFQPAPVAPCRRLPAGR